MLPLLVGGIPSFFVISNKKIKLSNILHSVFYDNCIGGNKNNTHSVTTNKAAIAFYPMYHQDLYATCREFRYFLHHANNLNLVAVGIEPTTDACPRIGTEPIRASLYQLSYATRVP